MKNRVFTDERTSLMCFLLACSVCLQAQEVEWNHPSRSTDGKSWVQVCLTDPIEITEYLVSGDTVIDNKQYKCVHDNTWWCDKSKGIIRHETVNNCFFIREDADGVEWRRFRNQSDDLLLIDAPRYPRVGDEVIYGVHTSLSDLRRAGYEPEEGISYRLCRVPVESVRGMEDFQPVVNDSIRTSMGNVKVGDLMHQEASTIAPDLFICLRDNGLAFLLDKDNVNLVSDLIGMHVLWLVDDRLTYRPFVEDGKRWIVQTVQGRWMEQHIDGDTIIAGHHCKIWWQRDKVMTSPPPVYPTFTEEYLPVYVYEEERKVYFFFDGDTEPRLFFDFGANIGDTLYIETPSAYIHQVEARYTDYWTFKVVVAGVRKVVNQDRSITAFKMEFDNLRTDYWKYFMDDLLEGIGFPRIPAYDDSVTAFALSVTYCAVGDDVLFYDHWIETLDPSVISAISAPTEIEPSNREWLNGKCYDFTGRRLAAPPRRGLYIEDGHIRVASK